MSKSVNKSFSMATLVVKFASLHSHLSPERLRHKLMEGLDAYGANPMLQFAVPNGASCLLSFMHLR
ncbi:hypothetical protein L0F63_005775 [Massospora cicadina]|nr:hypothetical protein L0F63_005775 [Massospora cicadina]